MMRGGGRGRDHHLPRSIRQLQQFSVFRGRSTGTGWNPQNARNEPRPVAPDDHEAAHRQSISPAGRASARAENFIYIGSQPADLVNDSYPLALSRTP